MFFDRQMRLLHTRYPLSSLLHPLSPFAVSFTTTCCCSSWVKMHNYTLVAQSLDSLYCFFFFYFHLCSLNCKFHCQGLIQELNVIEIRAIILWNFKIEILSMLGFLVNFSLEFSVFFHCTYNSMRRCEPSIYTNPAPLFYPVKAQENFSLGSVWGLEENIVFFLPIIFHCTENLAEVLHKRNEKDLERFYWYCCLVVMF